MKTLQIFFGMGAAMALLGANVAIAEIRFGGEVGMRPLEFTPTFETEGGVVTLPTLSFCNFDSLGGEEAQATCAMTPGGTRAGLMPELPDIQPVTLERSTPVQDVAFSPGTLPSQRPYNERPLRGGTSTSTITIPEDPETPPPPGDLVPEPATLLLVGLGIAGVAAVRRRHQKV